MPKRCVNNDDGKCHTYIRSDYRRDEIRSKKILHSKWNYVCTTKCGCEIWKYDWCLPSVDRTAVDNRDAAKTTLNEEHRIWISSRLCTVNVVQSPSSKTQTNAQIRTVALMCLAFVFTSLPIYSMLLQHWSQRSVWGAACPKNRNDSLLATKCKKFNFPTAHNAAGNVDEFSRFCRFHLLHSRSQNEKLSWNGWARRKWTTGNPSTKSLWIFGTK